MMVRYTEGLYALYAGPWGEHGIGSVFYSLTISLHVVFWSLSYLHTEHDYLRCHGGHLVAETVLVQAVHVCRKCILATGLSLSRVYDSIVRSNNLE